MMVHRLIPAGRFAVLFLFAGAFACGDPEVEPDPNGPPVAVGAIPPLSLVEGDSQTVDVSAFFSDPDGDQLSYSASSSDNSVLTVSVSGSNVTANAVARGQVQVTVTATDPDGASASHMAEVTVEAANQAPVAVGKIPAVPLSVGEEITAPVDNFFMDPDGDTLTYAAESSDTAVVTTSIAVNLITVVAVGEGEATITVTATDPGGLSATQTTTATVKANRAPRISKKIPDQNMTPGDTVTVDAEDHFIDPDGDTLTFTIEAGGSGVASVSVDGSIVTIVATGTGVTLIWVTATDPGGLSAEQVFTVSVTQGDQGPEAVGEIPAQTVRAGETVTVDVSGNFSGPDDDARARAPGCAAGRMTWGGGHRRLLK